MTEEPLEETDEIRLSHADVRVPWEKRNELTRRLEAAGLKDVADGLMARRPLAGSIKPKVLQVLNDWLAEVKPEGFGGHLENLRRELEKDVTGHS